MQLNQALQAVSISLLDAEILLAHVLNVPRSYLRTWPEKELSERQQNQFFDLVKRREQGEPVAYLVGMQEFWSLPFEVNEYTLVPRPETELLVELGINIPPLKKGVAELARRGDFIIADLGTGSGAIAIAIAHERPHWQCLAADRSPEALAVAKRNAARFELSNLSFYQGNWCQAFPAGTQCDAIISNPPYIAEHDPHLQEDGVSYEPITALVSGEDGLDDIRDIALQARSYLKPGGWLLLEHGHDQGARVSNILHAAGYTQIKTHQDLAGLDRVTVGQYLSNQDVVYSPA